MDRMPVGFLSYRKPIHRVRVCVRERVRDILFLSTKRLTFEAFVVERQIENSVGILCPYTCSH